MVKSVFEFDEAPDELIPVEEYAEAEIKRIAEQIEMLEKHVKIVQGTGQIACDEALHARTADLTFELSDLAQTIKAHSDSSNIGYLTLE